MFRRLSVPSPPPFHMLAIQKTSLELLVIRSSWSADSVVGHMDYTLAVVE